MRRQSVADWVTGNRKANEEESKDLLRKSRALMQEALNEGGNDSTEDPTELARRLKNLNKQFKKAELDARRRQKFDVALDPQHHRILGHRPPKSKMRPESKKDEDEESVDAELKELEAMERELLLSRSSGQSSAEPGALDLTLRDSSSNTGKQPSHEPCVSSALTKGSILDTTGEPA